ncbi:hypothetical protein AAY473_028305 [Plecturocebus cupreus]
MMKPLKLKNIKISWAWWHAPVIPATWEAEGGESLEPGSQVQWLMSVILALWEAEVGESHELHCLISHISLQSQGFAEKGLNYKTDHCQHPDPPCYNGPHSQTCSKGWMDNQNLHSWAIPETRIGLLTLQATPKNTFL